MFHDHRLQTVDGSFLPDGTFVALPPVPEALLLEGFRRAVLAFLVSDPFSVRPCGGRGGRALSVLKANAERMQPPRKCDAAWRGLVVRVCRP